MLDLLKKMEWMEELLMEMPMMACPICGAKYDATKGEHINNCDLGNLLAELKEVE